MNKDPDRQSQNSADAEFDVAEFNEAEQARAGFYGLLARLLSAPPDAALLQQIGAIQSDDSPLGESLSRLARLARATDEQAAYDEFSLLFYGKGEGGEVLPYASYYRTGVLNDKPLADLRGDMADLGIARGDLNKEPEDHIAFVLEMMHGLITGAFGAGRVDIDRQVRFYNDHLAPWAIDFFEDLEAAKSATLYAAVAGLGLVFLSVEQDAFQMAA